MKTLKLFIAVACSALALASCTSKNFSIKGIADDECGLAEGAVVLVCDGNGNVKDTCLVKDGKFSYSGPIDVTGFIAFDLAYPGKDNRFVDHCAAVIPDKKNIEVVLRDSSYVNGSPLTEAFNDFQAELMRLYTESEDENEPLQYCREVFLANTDNIVGANAFSQLVYDLPLEEFDELFEKAGDFIKAEPEYARIRAAKEVEAKTAPGAMFVDFEGVTPDGAPVKLSDFVGKGQYVLVDFWASWCGPCMRSMPGMKAIYEEYAPKGLQVLGVAVWDGDNSRSRVRIEERGMTWPQIFVGDDKTATDSYGILGIPHVIIFAPDGTIESRQTPDEEKLAAHVAELYK